MNRKSRIPFSIPIPPGSRKKIRSKYLPREESKLETLRRLDAKAAKKATVAALAPGIIGAFVLGLGMSCTMVWADKWFIPRHCNRPGGYSAGCRGLSRVCPHPKKERERLAPEILRLKDELMK